MEFRITAFSVLLVAFIISIFSGSKKEEQILSGTDSMLHCNDTELCPYNKAVFINGKEINESLSVVTYNNQIYFSVNILQKEVSNFFISQHDNDIVIRRSKIAPSAFLQSEENVYIDFNVLAQYVHINNNVFYTNGNMYIDTMLPASVNIDGTDYYLNNSSEFFDPSVSPNMISNDGRGVWISKEDVYIEDDWGSIFVYIKSGTT